MSETFLGVELLENWIFALILFLLGFALFKLIKFNKNHTTGKFKIKFWIRDNFREFFAGLIIFYISFRFHDQVHQEFLKYWDTILFSNKYLFTFVISVGMNLILEKLREKLKMKTASTN